MGRGWNPTEDASSLMPTKTTKTWKRLAEALSGGVGIAEERAMDGPRPA